MNYILLCYRYGIIYHAVVTKEPVELGSKLLDKYPNSTFKIYELKSENSSNLINFIGKPLYET